MSRVSWRGAWRALWLVSSAAALGLTALTLGAGCGGTYDNHDVKLAPPEESTTLGAGDVFQLRIVGEQGLPEEFQVASDGTVDLPYVERMQVEGLEPQELSAKVRAELIRRGILTSPSVVVSVKEYNSKRVSVLGQVGKPGSYPFRMGLTIVDVISQAGGLNPIANGDRVFLTRRTRGSSKTVVVSFKAITDGRSPDIPLQAGDQIFANERVF